MNYEKVPQITTGKDLDYLNDMFKWNYNALKNGYEAESKVSDKKIKLHLKKCNTLFEDNINNILNILENGGQNEN